METVTGNDALTAVAAEGICDLRRDVAKCEADVKDTIHNQSLAFGAEFCSLGKKVGEVECTILKNAADIAHRDSLHLASVERDLQNRVHESRQVLTALISDKTDNIKDQLRAFEMSASEKFCSVKTEIKDSERRILDRLYADKLDEKNEIIESLRHERNNDRFNYQFGLQNAEINYMKQMMGSIEQNQRFSSKTVQFGTGNLAGTAQTANQG